MPAGVAIVGSGIFAREAHLPAVQAASGFELRAVYSRSLKSARNLAAAIPGVELYSEDAGAGKQYADLLSRPDVAAVIIALPIIVQPDYIRLALAAGKHVLSEKPIAGDLATAQSLVQWYEANIDANKVIWAVAENIRYFTTFASVTEQVRMLGRVKSFRARVHNMVKIDSKYYNTDWRKTPAYQGGFILDGGIHMVAALRMILGSDEPLTSLSAQSCLLQSYLPPVDTVDAVMRTRNGATGVFSLSYGSPVSSYTFEFICEGGVVNLNERRVTVNGESHDIPFDGAGVEPEVVDFATSVTAGRGVQAKQSVYEALADLEILEKLLKSGESRGERMELNMQQLQVNT